MFRNNQKILDACDTIGTWLCAGLPLFLAVTRGGADVAASILGGLFLLRSVMLKDWTWIARPDIKSLGMLWGAVVLSGIFSPYDTPASTVAALIWGRMLLLYAALRFWLFSSGARIEQAGRISGFILLLVAVDTFWQYKTGISLSGRHTISDRLTGPLGTANIGNFMVKAGLPVVAIGLWNALRKDSKKYLPVAAMLLSSILSIVLLSGERSTPLLLLVGIGVCALVLMVAMPRLRLWVMSTLAVLIALIALLAATQPIIPEKAAFFVEQLSTFWTTYYGQMFIASARLWQQYPITGIGAKMFLQACVPELLNVTYCDVHPHNLYVEWLVACGSLGVCAFAYAMWQQGKNLLKTISFQGENALLAAFSLAQFALLLFPFVITQSLFNNWAGILFWYSLALAMSLPKLGATQS